MKKLFKILFISILFYTGFSACKKNVTLAEAEKTVTEWTGKQIVFPPDVPCISLTKDTTCISPNSTPYKILVYTDSTGCTTCKLHLYKWNTLIEEVAKEVLGLVNFQFYFQPKDLDELKILFRRDNFIYPSYIDVDSELNRLNSLPANDKFQTFLLDEDNKVVSIGNPANNPQIWELYKKIIKGEENISNSRDSSKGITEIEIDTQEIELSNLKVQQTSTAIFTLKNIGNKPLFIKYVEASCGCTVPKWAKKPVLPNESTEITVEVVPNNTGYFRKVVTVYCNTEKQNITLAIKGVVEN